LACSPTYPPQELERDACWLGVPSLQQRHAQAASANCMLSAAMAWSCHSARNLEFNGNNRFLAGAPPMKLHLLIFTTLALASVALVHNTFWKSHPNEFWGALDTDKCDDCKEKDWHFYECFHWGPPNSTCNVKYCIDDILYYSACGPIVDESSQSCVMSYDPSAVTFGQLVYKTANDLSCTDNGTWDKVEKVPQSTDCQDQPLGFVGKCFLESCTGQLVDAVDGLQYNKDVVLSRYICGD